MGIRLLLLVASLVIGCGGHHRHETIGSVHARVEDRHASRTSAAVPVAASRHRHRIAYRIELPRAVEVHYAIECPAVREQGTVGETWEAYRERRLAELEQERAHRARAAGAVTEALLGDIGARASIATPVGQGQVAAEVDGRAVGEAVAEQALPPVALSPADTGARQITGTLEMPPPEAGQCALSLWSERPEQDLRGVTANITLTAIVDLDAEKRARVVRAREDALAVRGELSARLIAQGADPGLQARLRAEARLRVEAEQRQREQAAARVRHAREEKRRLKREAEQRTLALALHVRSGVCEQLIAQGADPLHRQRQAEAKQRARAARARQQEEAWLRAQEALLRQSGAALEARADVVLWLRGNGAVMRPPRPPAPSDVRPPQTSATAVWIEGDFQWIGGTWVWRPGRWAEPPTSRAVWLAPAEVLIEGVIVVRPGRWIDRQSGKRVNVRVRPR